MPRFSRAGTLAASAAAVLAFATACGSSGTSSSKTTTPAPPSATSTPQPSTPSTPSTGSAAPALEVTTNSTLGQIVTDGSGFTLYRFDQDTANPSMSTCTGSCSTLWPPALAPSQVTSTGLNTSLIGTVTRADGTKQLTLNGWPLYRYSPDAKAGDTKGEGFGGIWFASTPTGGKAMVKSTAPATPTPAPKPTPAPTKPNPSPMTPSPSTGGGGYGY